MRTEESVKCSESRGIKYLTVREQEPWDRIFYYSMEAEVQHVPRYKGGHCVRTTVFISSVKLQRDPDPNFPLLLPFSTFPPSSTKVHLENLKLPPRLCNQWHLKHGHTSTPHLFTVQHIDGLSTSEHSLRGTHKPCVTDRGGLGGAAGTSLRGSPLAKSPVWPRGRRFGRVWGVIVKEVISSSWHSLLLCKCSSLHPSQSTQI